MVQDTYLWGACSRLSVTRAGRRLQDPSLGASPLALAPHGSWRVPLGIGHHPQAAGKEEPPILSPAGGKHPCPHELRMLCAPLLGAVPARGFRIGHHPWGACLGLSMTRAGRQLQDPSLVAFPLALAPHGSWRCPSGKGHHPQAARKGGTPVLSTAGGQLPCPHLSRAVLKGPDFFFLLRTALKDHPKGPPTANRQLPSTANCHQPPTTNRRQLLAVTNRQLPTIANRHQPPITNHQPPPTPKGPWSFTTATRTGKVPLKVPSSPVWVT